MAKNEAFLTCSFKLHNPTAKKRAVLDYVFDIYTRALGDVLVYSQDAIDEMREHGKVVTKDGKVLDKYTNISLAPFLPRCSELNYPIASNLKESLLCDVASGLASFLSPEGTTKNRGYPQSRDPSPDGYPNALENFALVGADLEDENDSKRQLLGRTKSNVMPLYISRSRDFAILYDRKYDRFFLWIKLLPAGHELATPTIIDDTNLVDLNNGEIFKSNSKIAVLFPLEVGIRNDRWHWQFRRYLEPLGDGRANVKSAKLIRDETKQGYEYFINVSFKFSVPEVYEPETYLGIDRGVFFSMAYAIVAGQDGAVIKMNHSDDGFRHNRIAAGKRVQNRQKAGKPVTVKDYRQKHLDSILHSLVNDILDDAEKHRSMIVFEDLNIQIKGKFYKSAWKKMYNFVEYKAKMRGIPVWKNGIWAAYSSQICIYCGELNRDRKRDGSPFVCKSCGSMYHSDEGAAVNIARRALYRKDDWKDNGGYMAFHKSFANVACF